MGQGSGNVIILCFLTQYFVLKYPSILMILLLVFLIFLHIRSGGISLESLECDIISFARNKSKLQQPERICLTNRIILVQGDSSVASEISALEAQLHGIFLGDLEGAKVRSKAQWIEDGGNPLVIFFSA